MRSMKRPSRRVRLSATTILKNGRAFAPPRASRMTTMIYPLGGGVLIPLFNSAFNPAFETRDMATRPATHWVAFYYNVSYFYAHYSPQPSRRHPGDYRHLYRPCA